MKRKKLHIAQIAPPWVRIPPKKYGGIELIIKYLCDGLVNRGHKVTLFASGDSLTKAKLVSVWKHPLLEDHIKWTDYSFTLLNIAKAYERADKFDIIHGHNDQNELFFSQLVNTPTVHTMHNPLRGRSNAIMTPRIEVLNHYANKTNFVIISKSQLAVGDAKLKPKALIYNGVDINAFSFNAKPSDHFVWIARVDKVKGIGNAVTAAKRAKVKLIMAGLLDYTHRDYYDEVIRPQLSQTIRFIGEIGGKQKSTFYRNAKALLYPIEWDEPFGLVMTEAMACGTPVIAFDRGSVREVVKDGKTGFIVKTIPEMVRAMKKIDTIDRAACRDWVAKKFSVDRMVDQYEELYYRIIDQHKGKRR